MTVEELNAMTESDAIRALRSCCGVESWAKSVALRRPFVTQAALLEAADDEWRRAGPSAWHESFAHHPRIGEKSTVSATVDFSQEEQSAAMSDDAASRRALQAAQRQYEQRFGHIYLVFATGKSAKEMLADVKQRLRNSPDQELAVAAEEQRKITRLRLQTLFINAEPGGV